MHSESAQSASRLSQQKNLLGGMDVSFRSSGGGRARTGRTVRVDEKRLGFAAALMLVVENGRNAAAVASEFPRMAICPRCGHRGPTDQDFGTRVIRGQRRAQSWCRGCRAHHPDASTSSTVAQQDFVFVP